MLDREVLPSAASANLFFQVNLRLFGYSTYGRIFTSFAELIVEFAMGGVTDFRFEKLTQLRYGKHKYVIVLGSVFFGCTHFCLFLSEFYRLREISNLWLLIDGDHLNRYWRGLPVLLFNESRRRFFYQARGFAVGRGLGPSETVKRVVGFTGSCGV